MSKSEAEAAAEASDPTPHVDLLAGRSAPRHNITAVMNFEQLIAKVRETEYALEAQERRVSADLRQLRGSWKSMWTPGRVVIAGLVTGFVAGRAEPFKFAGKGGSMMQMITMLSGLFATGSARNAAEEAGRAAESTDAVAETVAGPDAVSRAKARVAHAEPEVRAPEPAAFVAPVDP